MRWRLKISKNYQLPATVDPAKAPSIIDSWLASIGTEDTSTRRTYGTAVLTRAMPLIARLGYGHDIDRVGAERVMSALRRRYGISTVNVTAAALTSLWGEFIRQGVVRENPWTAVTRERPQVVVGQRLVSADEVLRMIDRTPVFRDRVLLRLLYVTGSRISEIVRPRRTPPRNPRGLRWRDVRRDAEICTLSLYGKGGKSRYVALPPSLATDLFALSRVHAAEDSVLPMTRARAWQIVRAAAKRAGIDRPVSPHWFRHASAVQGLAQGEPINVLQARLGHSNLATTSIYTEIMSAQGQVYVDDPGAR